MRVPDEGRECPRCKGTMRPIVGSEWRLWDAMAQDFMCPNCLHVEVVRYRRRHDGTFEVDLRSEKRS